ncbi:MAG: hypothetical protein KDC26_06975 [Armatimonadetes bacterium]|nr:hypothetical protein [Armatimonadota bacterium]
MELRANEIRERADTALTVLNQLGDLFVQMRDLAETNSQTAQGEMANRRLIESTATTVEDMVFHTRIEGRTVLGSQLDLPSTPEARLTHALKAYAQNEVAFQSGAGRTENNSLGGVLALIQARVSGPNGIVHDLRNWANSDVDPAKTVARFDRYIADIDRLHDALNEAVERDRAIAVANGMPYDLAG